MGTLSGSQKRRRVKLADDSRVFQEGTVKVDGDAALKSESRGDERERSGAGSSGGSLSTYKELCSVVTDIGQPDLIYKFMDLANYQAMLNSSKGAYGFASIARRAGDALAPRLAKLLPKLYRMQHDPNPRMREAVKGIWEQVVDDPRAAVDAHFAAIMEELLAECGSRTWRARQSSAGALAEIGLRPPVRGGGAVPGARVARVAPGRGRHQGDGARGGVDAVPDDARADRAPVRRAPLEPRGGGGDHRGDAPDVAPDGAPRP